MTLTLALKTDKEVYLASDSRSHFEIMGKEEFKVVQKYVKINDHVEVLISGILDLALGFLEGVKRSFWKQEFDIEYYDAFDVADEIEKKVTPSYKDFINSITNSPIGEYLKEENISLLDFLKVQWPLELIVGGMDKDKNGNFIYPAIYCHTHDFDYIKCKSDGDVQLGGAPTITSIAESYVSDLVLADSLPSSINYEGRMYSCFMKTIQEIEQQMGENEIATVGVPIHIARITKDGYEVLR